MKQYTLKSSTSPVELKIDYQKELNEEQYKVITEGDGPCLVLAGAGSGKTRTLVYRLLYLLEHGISPNRIMLVTFTNKAAKEMMNRTEVLYKSKPKGLWGGTFHSIGNRILRQYGKHIGILPNFNILDTEDSKTLVKACLRSAKIPQDKYFPKADLIRKIISLSANLAEPVEDVMADRFSHIDENYISYICAISEEYKKRKKQANALDYDDLLSEWNRLLLEKPEVREKLASQFQYILVDEYQDTNHIQGEVINHLAGKDQNVLVVGDDSQSIYSFRGADVNNILTFPKDYPNSKTFRLETNYRSTPEILELANYSIRNNKNKFDKNLHTSKAGGQKPALVPLEDSYQQAEFICQRILDLQDEDVELDNIAILFRAHYLSLELEMEMNKRNIPYVMRGGLRFFEQAHIKDITAYLKIVNNIHDELSWQRVLQIQAGIGGATSNKIWQMVSSSNSLDEVISIPIEQNVAPRVGESWSKIKTILMQLNNTDSNHVATLIDMASHNGYREYLKNNFENFQDRIDDIDQLVIFAESYDSLDKFLSDVALSEGFKGETMSGSEDGSDEAVTLTTIHQAKGLEWKVVFVIGLADGQFPNINVFNKPKEIEEERRLFYVATTRAEDQLYLTYPLINKHNGNISQLSQFVKELPEMVYEQWRVNEEKSRSSTIFKNDSDSNDDFSDKEEIIHLDDNGERIYNASSDDEEGDISKEFWSRFKSRQ